MTFLTGFLVGLAVGALAGGSLGALIVGCLQLARHQEQHYDSEVRW